jgi:cyclic beta-1,2-glucan synthetase
LDTDQRGRLSGRRSGGSFPASPRRGRLHDDAERDDEQPIAAELFSIERLEQHARTLAAAQHVRPASSRGQAIRPRVAENGRVLVETYRVLAQAIKEERTITPAAEWLVDNFAVVDEQLREIRDDLPSDYYRELPKLAGGHLDGYPRVLGLAWAYIAHTDSRFDPESLRRMVRAYQEVEPLTIGELWAIAISLRILYVENLRRLAERIVRSRADRQAADELADRLLGLVGDESYDSSAALRQLSRAQLSTAGRVQLFQRFRDQDPAVTPALRELDRLLRSQGTSPEELVQLEHQRMATMNVTVRNVVTSMRLISWFDWAEFVESVGLVDDVLRSRSHFAEMDFVTRNRYRNAVEELARRSQRTEVEVATLAVDMAENASASDSADTATQQRIAEPGYYLISRGRGALERALGASVPTTRRMARTLLRAGGALYAGLLLLVSASVIALWLLLSNDRGLTWIVAILAIGPAAELAVTIVNHTVTRSLGPLPLPRLDLDEGVPTGMRTLVAVPMLLTSVADVDAQVAGLEVHYLGNRDGDLRFALLSDWLDADSEQAEGDDELLAAAASGIDRLNEQYGDAEGGGARFLLLHRARRWNPGEQRWMGWERKRGKLEELNALLRGSTTTTFLRSSAPRSLPPTDVRYVVTLDADTRLPRGVIGRLVGTIAHPLNQPSFDARTGRVTDGYGLLQPRITPTLPERDDASMFQRIFAGPAGIDPYATAVSDVYQDLFEEGSFTGKGIYDVDAFSSAMHDRVPENALLSHDLFEGVFARAGLVTDVELFDEFPSDYLEASARLHRWARGDWQLLPWISRPSTQWP